MPTIYDNPPGGPPARPRSSLPEAEALIGKLQAQLKEAVRLADQKSFHREAIRSALIMNAIGVLALVFYCMVWTL
jgi:hypothetical protein